MKPKMQHAKTISWDLQLPPAPEWRTSPFPGMLLGMQWGKSSNIHAFMNDILFIYSMAAHVLIYIYILSDVVSSIVLFQNNLLEFIHIGVYIYKHAISKKDKRHRLFYLGGGIPLCIRQFFTCFPQGRRSTITTISCRKTSRSDTWSYKGTKHFQWWKGWLLLCFLYQIFL